MCGCVRTAYTHGYTQSSSTRRTGWTAGDKGGEQEARMCRVFNLMRQAKPMHTIIINTPLPRFHTHTHCAWKLIKSPIVTVQVWKWFGEWNTFSIYLIPSLNSANYASLPDCTFAERIRFPHLDGNTQACRWRQMVIWGKEDYERDRKREGVGLVNHLSVAVVSLASTLTRGLVFFGAADED